jgi:hypothetical protein
MKQEKCNFCEEVATIGTHVVSNNVITSNSYCKVCYAKGQTVEVDGKPPQSKRGRPRK